jgi:Leucine-rich repeat (LRR) protein
VRAAPGAPAAPRLRGCERHQALGDVLRKNMRLRELHLHNNKLGYEGVEKLCEELAKPLSKSSSKPGNKILEVLVLRNNGIGPHCAGLCSLCRFSPEFPTAILDLTSLRLVDFNHNELVHMPLEIAKLPKLVGLDLRNNAIANIPEQVMVTARSGTAESVRAKLQERRAVQGHE